MKVIVSFLGIKGGSGKSTSSNLFAHGVAKFGHYPFLLVTDPRFREGLDLIDNKQYITIDGRTEEGFLDGLSTFKEFDEGNELAVLAIDGGANESRELDFMIAEQSDIVVIPFMHVKLGLEQAEVELTLHQSNKTYGLPNEWPTNPNSLKKANRALDTLLTKFGAQILEPNYECNATTEFFESNPMYSSRVNSLSKILAHQILEKAGINAYNREHTK